MLKTDKERIVEELAAELGSAETLIVADYRGLTNKQLEALRDQLLAARRALPHREEHADAPRGRAGGSRRAPRDARGADGDRVHRVVGRSRRRSPRRSPRRRRRRTCSRCAAASSRARRSRASEVDQLATLPPVDVLRGSSSARSSRRSRSSSGSSRRRCATCTASSTPASSSSRSRARSSSPSRKRRRSPSRQAEEADRRGPADADAAARFAAAEPVEASAPEDSASAELPTTEQTDEAD